MIIARPHYRCARISCARHLPRAYELTLVERSKRDDESAAEVSELLINISSPEDSEEDGTGRSSDVPLAQQARQRAGLFARTNKERNDVTDGS